jgi:hypothetical protein
MRVSIRILFSIILLSTFFIISGCRNTGDLSGEESILSEEGFSEIDEISLLDKDSPVILGYCPTMASLAKEIQAKNKHISIKQYGFTAEALSGLSRGDVDIILVGRLAKKSEIEDAYESRLKGGFTLVGKIKKIITLNELHESNIHTYVSEDYAKEFLLGASNIVFHDSFDTAIREGLNDIVLIDWNDYQDNLELVIPVDMYMNKIEKFRIPVLYSLDKEIIDSIVK